MDNATLTSRFAAEHLERHSISEGRRIETMRVLDILSARLGGRLLIEITPSDLMAWQGAELKRGLAPTTMAKCENQVWAFVTWAEQAGLISHEHKSQLKLLSKPRGSTAAKRPRPYSPQQVEQLRMALHEQFPLCPAKGKNSLVLKRFFEGRRPFDRGVRLHARRLQYEAQIALALEEGLRLKELHELTLVGMHYDNVGVLVRTAKGMPGQRRERMVPYTSHARVCVKEWLDFRTHLNPPHDRPWLTLTPANPLTPELYRTLRGSLEQFGEFRWHRLRHTFATERLRAGMPLEQVSIMLGHAKVTQTLGYAEIVNADVQAEAVRTEAAFSRRLGLPVMA